MVEPDKPEKHSLWDFPGAKFFSRKLREMAYTAHGDPEQIKERYDSEERIESNAKIFAEQLKRSKHFIAFTGAGISTAANIPDFRGPQGVWTLAATGGQRTQPTTSSLEAIPTKAHMALLQLQEAGYLKHIVSQNCDGLFRKTGLSPDAISELHGNTNIEQCIECGKEYLRDFDATASYQFSCRDHRTGRVCVLCGGILVDSIINFGENLPEETIQTAFNNAEESDLCLVLGSSLTVTPACKVPEKVGKKAKLVICNLQNTPLDRLAAMRVYSKCDTFMEQVMKHLGIEIRPWILNRLVSSKVDLSTNTLTIAAHEIDATPASIFSGVSVNGTQLDKEPFEFKLSGERQASAVLHFFGHYNEKSLKLDIDCSESKQNFFHLAWNPMTGEWAVADKGTEPGFIPAVHKKPRQHDAEYKAPKPALSNNVQGGFSVHPISNCPHLGQALSIGAVEMVAPAFERNKCEGCNDSAENWMCLTCGSVCCSRYVKGHMAEHNEQNQEHCLAMSFSDLSVWCYKCDYYITHDILRAGVLNELHKAKFGEAFFK